MRIGSMGIIALAGCSFRPDGGAAVDALAGDGVVAFDAPPSPDAASGFDLGRCPGSYDPPRGTSRYRLRPNGAGLAAHAGDCDDDAPGLTHLVVVSDAAEADAIRTWLCPGASCAQTWIGAFAVDGVVFTTVTGEDGYFRWDAGQPGDFDTSPVAVDFNLGADAMTDLFMLSVGADYAAVCECDGRAPRPLPTLALGPRP